MHGHAWGAKEGLPFQSAPGCEAGRCGGITHFEAIKAMFQSAPGCEAGRCGGEPRLGQG